MAKTYQLLAATDATVSQASGFFDLADITNCSLQAIFSGGAGNLVGTLTLEGSNDNVNYATIPSSSVSVTASTGNIWSVSGAGYRFIRVRWVPTSGTGNIAVTLFTKDTVVKGV